jgi:hypothetical protein
VPSASPRCVRLTLADVNGDAAAAVELLRAGYAPPDDECGGAAEPNMESSAEASVVKLPGQSSGSEKGPNRQDLCSCGSQKK